MMTEGISAEAFSEYQRACHEIIDDLPYGKAMPAIAVVLSKSGLFDRVITLAERDARLCRALFDAVPAHKTYGAIVRDMTDPPLDCSYGIDCRPIQRRQLCWTVVKSNRARFTDK